MIFSVVFSYSDKNDSVVFRRRAHVRASCPETCSKKVSEFFLQNHEPTPSFRIESIKELFSVNYLIV